MEQLIITAIQLAKLHSLKINLNSMKTYLFLFLLIISSNTLFSQKISSIGIDFGNNILPLVTRYQGFTGGIVIQTPNNYKNNFEYIIGYTCFERPNNHATISGNVYAGKFTQKSQGGYFAFGKAYEENFGWHGILSIYNLNNTVIIDDNNFNAQQTFAFPNETMVAVGGDFFYGFPIKFSNKIRTSMRMSISMSIGTTTQNADMILYKPGFNQQTPKIFLPTFGFGLSMPLFLNLKQPVH